MDIFLHNNENSVKHDEGIWVECTLSHFKKHHKLNVASDNQIKNSK